MSVSVDCFNYRVSDSVHCSNYCVSLSAHLLPTDIQTQSQNNYFRFINIFLYFFLTDLILSDQADMNMDG